MKPFLFSLSCACLLGLPSCGGGGSDTPARSETGSAPATSGAAATTIHLVIGGGKHPGTYDVKSSEITCTHGFTGPGSWGNQYSVTGKKPNEFSSLQLIVPDTRDAADGTDKFMVMASFGELMQEGFTSYTIDTKGRDSDKGGSGTLTIDDRGKSGKVTFNGKTDEGVTLEGTIDCHQLMRGDG
jgi:hypothetical protein